MIRSFAPSNSPAKMQPRTGTFLFLILLFFFQHIKAQGKKDTLTLSIPAAEKIFLEKNLDLLAQQYNIEINKAYVQQAGYWDNPILNTDQNIYDGAFFRHNSEYGQVFIQLQQLIKTAGKRNKLIQLAKDGVLNAQQQFDDLMRNLRYLLRTNLFSLYQLQETGKIYSREESSLQRMVVGMDAQLQAGNISMKENIRIKSLLFSLQSDQAVLRSQIEDLEKDTRILLQLKTDIFIQPEIPQEPLTIRSMSLGQLLDSAVSNRPDLHISETNLLMQQHNLDYQKVLTHPDLTAGVEFDQRSSYTANYVGLSLSIPLPVFDRNKGGIRAAQLGIGQAQTQLTQTQSQSAQDVIAAYHKLINAENLQKQIPDSLFSEYDHLLQNMVKSYSERQIGLLELIDFFEAYKDSKEKQLAQQTTLRNAAAELDYATGTNMIPIQ